MYSANCNHNIGFINVLHRSQTMQAITLLNYGAGNVRSVRNAIKKLGYTVRDVSRPEDILQAEKLLLPRLGSFGSAMGRQPCWRDIQGTSSTSSTPTISRTPIKLTTEWAVNYGLGESQFIGVLYYLLPGFDRNDRPVSAGLGGRIHRNTHLAIYKYNFYALYVVMRR